MCKIKQSMAYPVWILIYIYIYTSMGYNKYSLDKLSDSFTNCIEIADNKTYIDIVFLQHVQKL